MTRFTNMLVLLLGEIMEDKKKRKQLCFDVHPNLHKEIKLRALQENISVNLWIHRVITKALKDKMEQELYHNLSI